MVPNEKAPICALLSAVPAVLFSLLGFTSTGAAEKTVGVIMTVNIPYCREMQKAFTGGMPAEGCAPGSAELILQIPAPEPVSRANAAGKFVAVGAGCASESV